MLIPNTEERPLAGPSRPLLIQSYTLVALGFLSVIARFVSRYLQISSPTRFPTSHTSGSTPSSSGRLHSSRMTPFKFFCRLAIDDCLIVLAFVGLVVVAYASNEVASHGSNYVEDDQTRTWTKNEVDSAIWGSKMLVTMEEGMIVCLWLVKACLLMLYWRLTKNLPQNIAVKLTSIYCALSFVIIQILYLGAWCRPISNYWAVPIPPGHEQCKTYHRHLTTLTILHVSTDLLILAIPLPIIIRTSLPIRQKLLLCFVFSLGVFVVLIGILNRYYNFAMPQDLVFLAWYNGEASTAVIIANVPFLWTLLRRMFGLEVWGGGRGRDPRTGPPTIGSGGGIVREVDIHVVRSEVTTSNEADSTDGLVGGEKQEW